MKFAVVVNLADASRLETGLTGDMRERIKKKKVIENNSAGKRPRRPDLGKRGAISRQKTQK